MATTTVGPGGRTPAASSGSRGGALHALTALGWAALVLAGLGVFAFVTLHFVRNAATPNPAPPPQTMADVNWTSPGSSVYCLSCHWDVGLATAGRDVQRGHSQNVVLNETQLRAVQDMGAVVGPGDTLICMSCHTLESNGRPYMLADTLDDSRLCQRCHPEHYARGTSHDLRLSAPDEKNRRGQTAAEGGPCSACHLAHDYAREIIPSPLDPDGWCITCHRTYGAAAEHAHTEVMHHPESHCLECHDSHDATHGAFLRDDTPELCLGCHAAYGGGVAAGMHPLGQMEGLAPQALLDAGAQAGDDDGRQVTCATCHSVHEAPFGQLLVLSERSNDLCLACHADALATEGGGTMLGHARSPLLNDAQRDVLTRWGGSAGAEGQLLCVSCHRVHGAEPQASLLAFVPTYEAACAACHPDQALVLGTQHDLALQFPDAENKAGLTPRASGACSACHMAHQFPRERTPGPGDPEGKCLSCHLAGRVAQDTLNHGVEHPDTTCTDCHNPHDRTFGRFMLEGANELCARCHEDQMTLRGGPHDITTAKNADRWDAAAREHGGLCLSCHVPHGGDRPDLFRVAAGQAVGNHDDVCLACHADAAWNAPEVGAIHPQFISPDQTKVELVLVPHDESGAMRMGCRTCHDPHGGVEPVHLARVGPGEPTEALCLHCHEQKQYIRYTGHSSERLGELGFDTDSCKPCHAMHADRDGTWGQMLSTRFLDRCQRVKGQPDCLPCLSCHRPDGPAPFQKRATHPPRMLAAVGVESDPGHLPLFNAQGLPDPQGEVVCRTCHVSHGRLDLLEVIADNPNWSEAQQHAVRAQLRPFLEPNTCTACHGARGRLLFLRFHDPAIAGQGKLDKR